MIMMDTRNTGTSEWMYFISISRFGFDILYLLMSTAVSSIEEIIPAAYAEARSAGPLVVDPRAEVAMYITNETLTTSSSMAGTCTFATASTASKVCVAIWL